MEPWHECILAFVKLFVEFVNEGDLNVVKASVFANTASIRAVKLKYHDLFAI